METMGYEEQLEKIIVLNLGKKTGLEAAFKSLDDCHMAKNFYL